MSLPSLSRFVAPLLAALLPSVSALALTIDAARLTAYGVFEEKSDIQISAPLTVAGYTKRSASEKLVKETDVIEARIGTEFGIDYVLDGKPVGTPVKLFIRLQRPAITNPGTGKTTTVDENLTTAVTTIRQHNGFAFDHEWEIVPGKWTFQIFHDSKLLLERSFDVRLAAK